MMAGPTTHSLTAILIQSRRVAPPLMVVRTVTLTMAARTVSAIARERNHALKRGVMETVDLTAIPSQPAPPPFISSVPRQKPMGAVPQNSRKPKVSQMIQLSSLWKQVFRKVRLLDV